MSFDETEVQTGRWQAYMDSFVSVSSRSVLRHMIEVLIALQPGDTAGLTLSVTRKPFLKRCVYIAFTAFT